MKKQYTVIYMAAGNSRRFGSNKLLYQWKGKPLYRYGLELLLELAAERDNVRLIVITQYEEILKEVRARIKNRPEASVFLNPQSGLGASYTVRRGVQEARRAGRFDYLIFVAADQPWLKKETLEKFLRAGEEREPLLLSAAWRVDEPEERGESGGLCCREKEGTHMVTDALEKGRIRLGNPVLFHCSLQQELLSLNGDEGGRKVWKGHAGEGGFVFVPEERELTDIDVREKLFDRRK